MSAELPGLTRGVKRAADADEAHQPPEKQKLANAWVTYPLAKFNSLTARPFSAVLAALRFSPNQVTLLSLIVSVVGLALVAQATWSAVAWGVLLVHLGLVLDHADGQVARRRGMSSEWGMYLDMVVDRVVEAGLVLAAAVAAIGTVTTPAWAPLPDPLLLNASGNAMLALLCLASMFLWRFLNAYNDVLYLRSHLRATGRVPAAPEAAAAGRFPVFNRDWVFMIWAVGLLAGLPHLTLALLTALHLVVCGAKVLAFWRHHRDPEARAGAVLDPDYH